MPDILVILLRILSFAAGLYIIIGTLISAIRTFVLPRSAPDLLTRSIFRNMRRLFNLRMGKVPTYEQRDSILAMYAPVTLLVMPAAWLACVMLGYALVYLALGVTPFERAFLTSGSSLLTLGIIPVEGWFLTLLAFTEAAIGLILVALLIAYLPTMYAAFSKRESLVALLEVRAGSPPSATELFRRYFQYVRMDELTELWRTWEIWFTELEETHTSLAALSFFRSQQPDRSWVTASGAVLDSAAIYLSTLDIPDKGGHAALTIRAGYLALQRIADFFGIPYVREPKKGDPISIFREEFDEACERLIEIGIPIKADRDQAWADYAGWRVNYDTVLISLATLTMAPYAPWSSDRSVRWNRPRGFLHKKRQAAVSQAQTEAALTETAA